jgi:hypothetical protein
VYWFTRRVIKLTVEIIGGYHCYEIIGDQQCGFRRNRSTIDQILCIHQILEKKWEFNETVDQHFGILLLSSSKMMCI